MNTQTRKHYCGKDSPLKGRRFNRSWLMTFLVVACISTACVHAEEDRLWVDATINGKPVRMVFDTGAEHMVLFKNAAQRLGMAPPKMPGNVALGPGEVPMGKYEPCEVAFWGQSFNLVMGAIDFPDYLKSHADGVLAWGDMRQNIFQIDVSGNATKVLERVPEYATNWTKFNLRPDSGILALENIEGNTTNSILVDTGLEQGAALSAKKWKEWRTAHAQQPTSMDASFMAGVGLTVSEEAWADQITLGPLHLTEVPVAKANSGHEAWGTPGFEAVIGMAGLRRMEMIVDGVNGVAYIAPKGGKPDPYEHNRLGAVFVPASMESNDLVAHVAQTCPAAKAGIADGDVLLKIDDLDVTKWRTDPRVLPLSRFWSQPEGTPLHLTLRREGRTNEVALKLENILGPMADK